MDRVKEHLLAARHDDLLLPLPLPLPLPLAFAARPRSSPRARSAFSACSCERIDATRTAREDLGFVGRKDEDPEALTLGAPLNDPRHEREMPPSEFRYWENERRGWVRFARAAGRLVGFDPAPPREVVEAIASMYEDGDPLADAFLDEVASVKDARAMFHRAARDGIASVPDAPASLRALFADVETPPDWLDPALVERGARVFRRYGAHVFRFAGAITLAGYSESSVAKPLAMTGGYVGGSARRRFLETVAFWIEVSEPGGLV
ncbi:MAG: hypothetical protein KIS78_22855, partial [Labilithrix sp.]|nr:hypothetical protein [Labilithrix sp.]